MPDFSKLTLDELRDQLERNESLLQDVKDEREFLGKQQNMHIVTSEFERLDRDRQKFERNIAELQELIASKSG